MTNKDGESHKDSIKYEKKGDQRILGDRNDEMSRLGRRKKTMLLNKKKKKTKHRNIKKHVERRLNRGRKMVNKQWGSHIGWR